MWNNLQCLNCLKRAHFLAAESGLLHSCWRSKGGTSQLGRWDVGCVHVHWFPSEVEGPVSCARHHHWFRGVLANGCLFRARLPTQTRAHPPPLPGRLLHSSLVFSQTAPVSTEISLSISVSVVQFFLRKIFRVNTCGTAWHLVGASPSFSFRNLIGRVQSHV